MRPGFGGIIRESHPLPPPLLREGETGTKAAKVPKERMALEGAAVRRLRKALGGQFQQVMADVQAGKSVDEVVAGIVGWEELRAAVERTLLEAADLGVEAGAAQLTIGIDWTLANIAAREWALGQAGRMLLEIDATTRRMLQQAVGRWIESGEPLSDLIRDLSPIFGRRRAETIAVTETTRAYAQANLEAWGQAGIVKRKRWLTARDEVVCPVCGELDGEDVLLDYGFSNGQFAPPAHVNCRCALAPVVEE